MSDRIRCNCRSCTIRSLMGPAVLITVGVLFLLEQTHSGFSFRQTWPVMLVVIGIINLASAMAPMDGHISSAGAPPVPPAGTPVPPANPVPGNYPRQGQ
ncbi:MAG TPA: DUF5668 domain-containing protein [Candidatus Acidoferrales bacterium]|jgi:hypothetical protein|nr:DUF5668 domain-containing protein [Candidatus Acidoferrales bacterium]